MAAKVAKLGIVEAKDVAALRFDIRRNSMMKLEGVSLRRFVIWQYASWGGDVVCSRDSSTRHWIVRIAEHVIVGW